MKYRFAIMLLALATAVAYAQVSGTANTVTAAGKNEVAHPPATAGGASSLPDAARANISAVLGREDHSYEISTHAGDLTAENSQHDLSAVFMAGGVHFRAGKADLGLAFLGYGYGNTLQNARAAAPRANLNRVEYRRGALTEWYVNGPLGLEQGFTLTAAPARKQGEPLTIALALSGDFTATTEADGTELTLTDRSQQHRLLYGGLASYDATGKQLRTWMEVQGAQLRLKVADAGAVYPLVVDPWVQVARLTASDGAKYDFFGNSMSVSQDGKTIVVAAAQKAVGKNLQQGCLYVFVEPTKGWVNTSTFKAKLTASDGQAGDIFGDSVVISADAKTIVVGAPQATVNGNLYQGKVYVYVEPTSGGWATTPTFNAELTASDGAAYDWLGVSVAFDGVSAVAGAYGHMVNNNPYQGAAYVFTEPTGGWTGNLTQTAELTSSDGQAWDLFGFSAAAYNGVAAVGAVQATVGGNQSQGAAYVFVEPTSGGWVNANENAKLTAKLGASEDLLGSSIGISSDTTTVVSGAEAANINGNGGQGAAYVFVRPSGGWTGSLNETAELTASDGVQEDYFGTSVAMNYNGSQIVVGAPLAPYSTTGKYIGPGPGKVYTYTKPTGGWATTQTYTQELVVKGGKNGAEYGISVGVNSNSMAAGAIEADIAGKTDQGAAFVAIQKK